MSRPLSLRNLHPEITSTNCFHACNYLVFGWVLASHQIGGGAVAFLAGFVRDRFGGYDAAFYVAGGLCAIAVVMSLAIVSKALRA